MQKVAGKWVGQQLETTSHTSSLWLPSFIESGNVRDNKRGGNGSVLTLLHSERPNLHRVLAILSAIG